MTHEGYSILKDFEAQVRDTSVDNLPAISRLVEPLLLDLERARTSDEADEKARALKSKLKEAGHWPEPSHPSEPAGPERAPTVRSPTATTEAPLPRPREPAMRGGQWREAGQARTRGTMSGRSATVDEVRALAGEIRQLLLDRAS